MHRLHASTRAPACVFGCDDCDDDLIHYVVCPFLRELLARMVDSRCVRLSASQFLCLEHVNASAEGVPWGLRIVILSLASLAYHSCKDHVGDKSPAQRRAVTSSIFAQAFSQHRQHLQRFVDLLAANLGAPCVQVRSE